MRVVKYPLITLFLIGTMPYFGCTAPTTTAPTIIQSPTPSTPASNSAARSPNSSSTEAIDPSIEFTLKLTPEEKKARYKRITALPKYAKVSETVAKQSFIISHYGLAPGARDYPDESSLTGLGFIGEATRNIGEYKYTVVVMGPTPDRVDTVRLHAYGVQTNQARQQLQTWANKVLAALNRGQLPPSFIKKLFAGESVGDDGVSNGYCNVGVLQKPLKPSGPSIYDRITIDLIFDKQ